MLPTFALLGAASATFLSHNHVESHEHQSMYFNAHGGTAINIEGKAFTKASFHAEASAHGGVSRSSDASTEVYEYDSKNGVDASDDGLVRASDFAIFSKWATFACDKPTTISYQGQTYSISEATTLTIGDCDCTSAPTPVVITSIPSAAKATGSNESGNFSVSTKYFTLPCEGSTTFEYHGHTYTISGATTLTGEYSESTSAPNPANLNSIPIKDVNSGLVASASASVSVSFGYNATVAPSQTIKYTFIPCEAPTTVEYQGQTYTVTEATTLTIEDCDCTSAPSQAIITGVSSAASAPSSSTPSNDSSGITVTSKATSYTTIACESPTTVEYQGQTYTVTEATTLTIEDCDCTSAPSQAIITSVPRAASAPSSSTPSNGSDGITVTNQATSYTTIACESPTTVEYQGQTYTVTEATTLTIEDCDCTSAPSQAIITSVPRAASAPSSSTPFNGSEGITVTSQVTSYTTIACESPTTVEYQGQTYTVTEATTLTIEDCDCTSASSQAVVTSIPQHITVTEQETKYTTFVCDSPTTVEYQGQTYTVTEATTLTVGDCDCSSAPSQAGITSMPKPTSIGNIPAGSAHAGSVPAGSVPAGSVPAGSVPAAPAPGAPGSNSLKRSSAGKASASKLGNYTAAAPSVQNVGSGFTGGPTLVNAGSIAQVASAAAAAFAIVLLI